MHDKCDMRNSHDNLERHCGNSEKCHSSYRHLHRPVFRAAFEKAIKGSSAYLVDPLPESSLSG